MAAPPTLSFVTRYDPKSLHRLPEWRWELARWLVKNQQVILRERDPSVRAAACFFKELSACKDEWQHRRLAELRPHAYAAWSAYADWSFFKSDEGGKHTYPPQ